MPSKSSVANFYLYFVEPPQVVHHPVVIPTVVTEEDLTHPMVAMMVTEAVLHLDYVVLAI